MMRVQEEEWGGALEMSRLCVCVCVYVCVLAVTAAPGRPHSCLLDTLTQRLWEISPTTASQACDRERKERRGDGWKGLLMQTHQQPHVKHYAHKPTQTRSLECSWRQIIIALLLQYEFVRLNQTLQCFWNPADQRASTFEIKAVTEVWDVWEHCKICDTQSHKPTGRKQADGLTKHFAWRKNQK